MGLPPFGVLCRSVRQRIGQDLKKRREYCQKFSGDGAHFGQDFMGNNNFLPNKKIVREIKKK